MERRDFVVTGLAAVAGAALATRAEAAPAHQHGGGNLDPKLAAAIKAAYECIQTGQACVRHCMDLLGKGETDMKDCNNSVHNMLALCNAWATVASYDTASPDQLKSLAATCAKYCDTCAAACKVHAGHHAFCKACMDSCVKCSQACKAFAAA